MKVILVRHADAGRRTASGRGDEGRPLTESGREDAAAMGELMRQMKVKPDRVFSSTLKRSVETALLVSGELKAAPEVEACALLNPEGSPERFVEMVAATGAATVMAVGHNPSLTSLANMLLGIESGRGLELRKGCAARIDVTAFTPPVAELRWLITPGIASRLLSGRRR